MSQITVLPGPERRRRWGEEDRARILEAAFAPGASVLAVARRFDVATSLIYKWRALAQVDKAGSGIFPAVVTDGAAVASPPARGPVITIRLAGGGVVLIDEAAPAALVAAALRALR